MQNSIRQNAVESIQVGVEDFKNGSHSRIISSIRNIYAGLLLLYKSKLSELSPPDSDEVLIKDKIQPKINDDGKLNWIGKGSKTVDVQQIIDRFKNLNISIDDKTLLKIQKKRNDLEHYYLNGISIDTLKGIIADSFILIRDFTEKYLNLRTVALLGEQTYSILSEVAKFYNDELELCKKEISEFNNITDTLKEALFDFTCEKCGSGLVTVDDKNEKRFVCKSCNTKIEFDKIVPEHYHNTIIQLLMNLKAWIRILLIALFVVNSPTFLNLKYVNYVEKVQKVNVAIVGIRSYQKNYQMMDYVGGVAI